LLYRRRSGFGFGDRGTYMVLRFFILAALLFVTCAEGERDNPDDRESRYYRGGSSSSKQSSSSSAIHTLACAAVPSTGIAGTTIIPPVVTCNGMVVGYGLDWEGAPNWNNPAIGKYSNISVISSYGECNGKTARCSGTLTVIAAPSADELTCTGMPMTGVAGTAIMQPTVRCGINTVTSGIAWANAPNWVNPAASTYNVSATASCGGSNKTASCGKLTITPVLSCGLVPPSGTAGTAVTAPTVTCDGKTVSSGLDWAGAPNWGNPMAGTYSDISVSASSGNCSGETAKCSGTLTVGSVLACSAVPSTGIAGATITPPTVTCNGTNVPSSVLNWAGAPNWSNPVAGTYSGVSVSTSYGECNGKTANCGGTLTVGEAPSVDELTCTGMPMTGATGTAVTQPTVRCGINTVTSGIGWAGAPSWNNPAAGTYNVSATANCGGKQQTASCGTLTVASVLSCATVPTAGTAGMAITAPTVTCDGTTVSSGLSWTGAPNWSNPAAGTYSNVSVSASSGNCSGKTAACSGRLTVVSSSSSAMSSSSYAYPSSSYTYPYPSSSSKPSSSSIAPISSSSIVTYTLDCASVPTSGTAGTAITAPTVTCNGSNSTTTTVSSGLSWTGAPSWNNPVAGTYSGVSVYAGSGNCSGKTATCSGTLTVAAPVTYTLTCASVPSTGTAGTAITAPTVTCNGSNSITTPVSSSLSWTGAPSWNNPVAGTYSGVSVSTSSGNCSGKSATCSGTLTVAAPVTYTLTCASVPTIGAAGTAITAPTVTCNGSNSTTTNVSSGLSWTGAPNWGNLVGDTYSNISVSASSGNCSGKTAACSGTLTVQSGVISSTSVTYEGETYKTIVIGTQTWFQRNLNYAVEGSKCYNNSEANCTTYGRLYDWATAMNLPSSCNSTSCSSSVGTRHQGICPSGWHIPSDAEWTTLTNYVGGDSTACKYLKATSGWGLGGNGQDTYGFSALPGGGGAVNGSIIPSGLTGYWWSATEDYSYLAYNKSMYHNYESMLYGNNNKSHLFSVRCLQD